VPYLTEGEFGRWAEVDRDWKQNALAKLNDLTADSANKAVEIALLKVAHDKAVTKIGTTSAIISTVVTSITMGIVSAFK
jgi:hypothetical protein